MEGYDSLDETYVEHLRCRYFGHDVVIGRTGRIVLREIKIDDLEAFYDFSDAETEPVLKQFLKGSKEESKDYLQAYISSMYQLYDYGIWTIEDGKTGAVLGLCGFGRMEFEGEAVTELGYYIRPEKRRTGLATEAVHIALEYGKAYIELSEVYARVRKDNEASIRVLCKFGFEKIQSHETCYVYKKCE